MSEILTQIRVLIADLDEANQIMTDDLLISILGLHGGDAFTASEDVVYLAAATALDSIATTETLLGKKIKTQDLSTDGVAVGESLRKLAAQYRARAESIVTELAYWGYVSGAPTIVEGVEYQ